MRDRQNRYQKKIRQSLFPPSLFAVYLGTLFLISGIHTGLVVLADRLHFGEISKTAVAMVYWGLVAVGLTLFTRKNWCIILSAGHGCTMWMPLLI